MGFFTSLFKLPKTADKAVDIADKITTGFISGIDKIWHTDEEKSDARQKFTETYLGFWKIISNENSEQSKARRELAKMTFQVFFFFLLAAAAMYGFDSEYAKFLLSLAGKLMFLVSAIGVIYFGPHQLSKVVNWKNKK